MNKVELIMNNSKKALDNGVGIIGYGAYIPKRRIKAETIAEVWGKDGEDIKNGLMIEEKAVPGIDEDTATISVAATQNALLRAKINPREIGAIYVGSESHPYAVKPTATIVGDAINAGHDYTAASTEFACKAGTAAIQMCAGLVKSNYIKYGLAIGADTAQGAPGNALEYSAAAGGAAFIIGSDKREIVAQIEATYSYSSDTPDFWRRSHAMYPSHGGRFTGEPAYVKHVFSATQGLLERTGYKINDFDFAVFHMPNGKFASGMAKKLGIPFEKIAPGFVVKRIGNTYSGSSILGLCATLDVAKPNQLILLTSYGSGAGSDSFVFRTTDKLNEVRNAAPTVEDYIKDKEYVSYAQYAKIKGKLHYGGAQ
ncbi:Hydroxymethylglutaryl-CoA synthase [uncultured archaeon]|nr:Hydroxymethylglutaryl-CoA synthase [uncultured archaeon]